MLLQCCQCRKVMIDGRWVYPRFSQLEGQDVTHGYCDECFADCRREIEHHVREGHRMRRWFQRVG